MIYSRLNVNFLFNTLFCLFPISFVIGNQAINLNTLLLIFFTLVYFKNQIYKIKFNSLDKLLIIFFIYILISLIVNYIEQLILEKKISEIIFFKSIFYLRYLLLYLALRFLISKKIISIKLFSIVCVLSASFVAIDVFIQFFFGKNIIGIIPISDRHYSGVFGAELIAGGYLQKFAIFILATPFFLEKKNYNKFITQFIFLIIILFSIILTGNRIPLLLYLFSILIFIFIRVKNKWHVLNFFIIILLCLFFAFKNFSTFKINTSNFYSQSKFLISTIFTKDMNLEPASVWQKPYVTEFQCGKEAIKLNPIFGGGLRSYRVNFSVCNSHPHNYYLEIISDLGVLGLLIILIFAFKLFRKTLKNSLTNIYDNIIFPPFLILLMEFFPFRSSGSFFTTNNSTIIFIMLAMLVSLCSKIPEEN